MRYFSLRFCGFVVFTTLFGALTAFAQTTADFNGDGKLDIVQIVQCFPTPCTNSTIIVRLGQGNGSFRAPINSPTIGFPSVETVVGDFNSDKRLDIAFASFASPGEQIAVALGNGDGTFGATTLYPVPYPSSPFSVGDLNGDTKLDLVVSGPTLSVLLKNGDGTFRALPDAPPGAFAECALADANHDGKVDIEDCAVIAGLLLR